MSSFVVPRDLTARRLPPPLVTFAIFFLLFVFSSARAAAQLASVPELIVPAFPVGDASGWAVDNAGNLYIADSNGNVIRKVSPTGNETIVAGNGTAGSSGDGGPATSAELNDPLGVAVDGAGNIYIADHLNNSIRKVTAGTGIISTLSTAVYAPVYIAADNAGNLYVVGNLTYSFDVSVLSASTGNQITQYGSIFKGFSGDGGPATAARMIPDGVATDSAGNLYIADQGNNRVREVNASTGIITTIAGNGTAGFSGDGGPATDAELYSPVGVAVDKAGNVYIADSMNSRIREVNASTGIITTVVGNGTTGYPTLYVPPTATSLGDAGNVVVDNAGNLYYNGVEGSFEVTSTPPPFTATATGSTATPQNILLQVTTPQTISSIIAPPSQGGKQEFNVGTVTGCAVDGATSNPAGTVCSVPVTFQPSYPGVRSVPLQVSTSTGNYSVGMTGIGTGPQVALTPGIINTVAGNGTQGETGDGGPATGAELSDPSILAVDSMGSQYIADDTTIRKVDPNGTITTLATGLNEPFMGSVDSAGDLYVADSNSNVIIQVSPTGTVTTVAGNGNFASCSSTGCTGDGGPATNAALGNPTDVVVGSAGSLYIADINDNVVRMVNPSGIITTIAGNSSWDNTGDGGQATSAALGGPNSLAIDSKGNLYIALGSFNVVRKVDASTGIITTIAGNGSCGYSGDGGPATSAQLCFPEGLAVDSAGDLYIIDQQNYAVRMVNAATNTITTVAGGNAGYSGDAGPANAAQVGTLYGIALDSLGNIYVGDGSNQRVREINVGTAPPVVFATATDVGQTDSTDTPWTETVTNIGNLPLTLTSPSSGTNPSYPANFPANTNDNNLCSSTAAALTAGASCDVSAVFAPTDGGINSGSVTLTDNVGGVSTATQSISFSGTGIQVADVTTTTLVASSNAIPAGTSVQLTATVSDTTTSSSTPTGSVTITDTVGGSTTTLGTSTLNGGAATITATLSTQGTHVITANYGGVSGSMLTSTSSPLTVTVDKDSSTLSGPATQPLQIIPNQANSFTVSVTGQGSTAPTGTISYSVSGNGFASGTATITNGSATIPVPNNVPAGSYSVTVSYAGDSNYLAATPIQVSLQVGQIQPVLNWTPSASITYGTPMSSEMTATAVNGSSPVPGTFSYLNGSTAVNAGTVLPAGTYVLTVNFTPTDATTYKAATASATVTVDKAQVAGVIQFSTVNPVMVTNATMLVATVSSAVATPTGTVSFFDGTASTPLGTAALSGGVAQLQVSSLAIGNHSITAVYSGDAGFAGATSGVITEQVADFSLSASSSTNLSSNAASGSSGATTSATIASGGSASYAFTISPAGLTTLASAVNLTVSGLPASVRYTLTPTTIAAGSGSTGIKLVITSPSQTAVLDQHNNPFGKGFVTVALGLLLLPFSRRMRSSSMKLGRIAAVLFVLVAGALGVVGLTGCGATTSTQQAQQQHTYDVTITGTSGSLTHSTDVTLTVQ